MTSRVREAARRAIKARILRDDEELSVAQIAERLHVSTRTVKRYLARTAWDAHLATDSAA